MPAGMKDDKNEQKKKLEALEAKLKDEEESNDMTFRRKLGGFVEYGNSLQLLHVDSNCFMQATRSCADEDNSCSKVELAIFGSSDVYFKAIGGFKYK